MNPIIRLFLLLILIIGVFSISSSVYAEDHETTDTDDDDHTDDDHTDDHDDDEDEDEEIKNAYEREVQIEQRSDSFKIESEFKIGENKDQIQIEFDVEDEAEIEFEYKIEAGSVESELEFEVEFQEIIEYVDLGSVGDGYQDGEEVFEYDIEDVDWKPINYTTEVVDGANINVIRAETNDSVFVLIMRVAESLLDLESGVTLAPNTLKIDIEIHNFPYTQTGSSLAIKSKLKSETEFKVEDDTIEEGSGFAFDESQVAIGFGFFSWAESALADGTEISVVSSALEATTEEEQDDDKLETEVEQKMFFS
ncbi:MAG: hypothetical protein ACXAC2_11615, partial [Candidatus Kariarchaeaceae archaeon]